MLVILTVRGQHAGDQPGADVGPLICKHSSVIQSGVAEEEEEEEERPTTINVRAGTLDDAIDVVNRNPYGNGTAIFTTNGATAHKYTPEVDVCQLGGSSCPFALPMFSVTGSTRYFRGDFYGKQGIQFYTRIKM